MTGAPAWLQDLSLDPAGPPWLPMGLGRIPESRWLLPDGHRAEELALRAGLLAERHDEVFGAIEGTEAMGEEVLGLVLDWERQHAPALAAEPVVTGVHPLEAAGRRTQEDLVVMARRDGGHHLDAAVLCFPSHWRLADKLGGSAAAIHGPVPHYEAELEERVDRFLDRLRPGVLVARRNWSVHDHPDLFAPERPPLPAVDGDAVAGLWLRSERQTLRALPHTGAVLFTIRVQQVRFAALVDEPDAAERLARRLAAQPAELTEMNGVGSRLPSVLAWLRRIGETHGGGPDVHP